MNRRRTCGCQAIGKVLDGFYGRRKWLATSATSSLAVRRPMGKQPVPPHKRAVAVACRIRPGDRRGRGRSVLALVGDGAGPGQETGAAAAQRSPEDADGECSNRRRRRSWILPEAAAAGRRNPVLRFLETSVAERMRWTSGRRPRHDQAESPSTRWFTIGLPASGRRATKRDRRPLARKRHLPLSIVYVAAARHAELFGGLYSWPHQRFCDAIIRRLPADHRDLPRSSGT